MIERQRLQSWMCFSKPLKIPELPLHRVGFQPLQFYFHSAATGHFLFLFPAFSIPHFSLFPLPLVHMVAKASFKAHLRVGLSPLQTPLHLTPFFLNRIQAPWPNVKIMQDLVSSSFQLIPIILLCFTWPASHFSLLHCVFSCLHFCSCPHPCSSFLPFPCPLQSHLAITPILQGSSQILQEATPGHSRGKLPSFLSALLGFSYTSLLLTAAVPFVLVTVHLFTPLPFLTSALTEL